MFKILCICNMKIEENFLGERKGLMDWGREEKRVGEIMGKYFYEMEYYV